jgi:hypothetical protein
VASCKGRVMAASVVLQRVGDVPLGGAFFTLFLFSLADVPLSVVMGSGVRKGFSFCRPLSPSRKATADVKGRVESLTITPLEARRLPVLPISLSMERVYQ